MTSGYGDGEEVNMLQRRLLGTTVQFGVGANRAAVPGHFIQKYGYIKSHQSSCCEELCLNRKKESYPDSKKEYVPMFFTRMDPSYLTDGRVINSKVPLGVPHKVLHNALRRKK
ncbi:hypothetical protein K1719_014619 [Acacia pycnantha]|nr:hypothetical protein K1719_014619 [Acacia pycnantha]